MNGRLLSKLSIFTLLFGLLFSARTMKAQTSVLLELKNGIQLTDSTFQYDIWLTNTGLDTLKLRGYAFGVNHDPSMTTGTITHSFLSRDAALTTVPAVSAAYLPSGNHLRATTNNATAGNEVLLGFGVPVRLATMLVKTSTLWNIDFNTNLNLQLAPLAGRTQALLTVLRTPVGSTTTTNFVLNGPTNPPSGTTLQVISGLNNTPCFYLRPTGAFQTAVTSSVPASCVPGADAVNTITLSSTGSAAPYGTAGNYTLNGGASNAYTGSSFNLTGLAVGTYTLVTTTNAGCKDTIIENVTSYPATSSSSTQNALGSYLWTANNTTYTASGVYTTTLVNSFGCDSVLTLNLTITPSTFALSIVVDQEISCFGNNDAAVTAEATPSTSGPYLYGIDGGPITNPSGVFGNLSVGVHTICASNGTTTVCDTVSFTNPPQLTVTFDIDSLVSCLGNDGAITANIAGGTTAIQPYQTIWTGGSLVPNPGSITSLSGLTPATYTIIIEDDNGCFLTDSVVLGSAPSVQVTTTNNPIACAGGTTTLNITGTGGVTYPPLNASTLSYSLNGSVFSSQTTYTVGAGTYTITAQDLKGCSASAVTTITAPSANPTTTTLVQCNSYLWSGTGLTYTSSGTYSTTILTSAGCDSVAILNLTINYSSSNPPTTTTSCNSYTWPLNGVTYTTSGVKTATFLNAAGCDSNYTLNLTIVPTTNTTTNVTASNLYFWPVSGLTYTNSGVYTFTTAAAGGCVNTATLNLTINVVSFFVTLIEDQPISCNGNNDGVIQAVATGGVPPITFVLDGGVAVTSTGFFYNVTPGTHTVTAIDATLTFVTNTITFTQPDPILMVFTTDSIVSCLGNDGMISVDITGGTANLQPYLTWWYQGTTVPPTWPGPPTLNDLLTNNFATSLTSLTPGPYTVVTEDDRGCFDTTTYILGQAPPVTITTSFNPITCFGGTTVLNLIGAGGVTYAPTFASTLMYSINGSAFTAQTSYTVGTGTYTVTTMDYKGCSATTTVTISQPSVPITGTENVIECDFYTWSLNSTTYTNSGVYVATTVAANGCDSIVTLNLTINLSSQHAPQTATFCTGSSYTWAVNNAIYTTGGTYLATYLNQAGCDSNYTLILTENATTNQPTQNASFCTGNSYVWAVNGTTYTLGGTYTATYLNQAGCDSNYTLILTQNNPSTNTPTNASFCTGSNYVWAVNGVSYAVGGTYTATYLNAGGCDSNFVLNLTENSPSTNAPQSATICSNASYIWSVNGNTYSNAGNYTATYLNAGGCDSSYTLNLTVNPIYQKDTVVDICGLGSYTWPVTGITYSNVGVYSATFTTLASCDSNFSLTITLCLPVTLASFTGTKIGEHDELKWTTSAELNNAYFHLQYSKDGKEYTTIAKVNSLAPNGNSQTNIDYVAIHQQPSLGHNYYRLQQVDIDGKATIESKIVDLIRDAAGNMVTIYPNPTSELIHIDLFTNRKANTVIKVLDMSGRTVKQILTTTETGMNQTTISLAELADGLYTIQILENGKMNFVEKVRKGN